MNTNDLKELFLIEHKRDKRLTFISFALIAGFAILCIGVLFYIGANFAAFFDGIANMNSGSEYAWLPKTILGVVVLALIGYPFYKIWKVNQRPKEIDELLSRIAASSKATTIQEGINYKITIPLGKITFRFCPITTALIYLDSDSKPYTLPIRKMYIPDMKLVLSGANLGRLNEIRDALYSEETQAGGSSTSNLAQDNAAEDNTVTTLKTVEEFKTFITSDLQGTLNEMESARKSGRKMMIIFGVLSGVAVLAWMGYMFYSAFIPTMEEEYTPMDPMKIIIPFVSVIAVFYVIYFIFMRPKLNSKGGVEGMNYLSPGATFKEKVLTKMVKFINPDVEYMPLGHIGLPELFESGLFEEKNYHIDGNDQIVGRHSGVPFIMCDLSVDYTRSFTKENETPDSVFTGQFFVARFNKKFSTPVFIKPKTGLKGYFMDNDINNYTTNLGEKVTLEDPEFNNLFNVYAIDQVEARYILTPSLMERIKELAKRTKGQYYIAFNHNKITVMNNNKKNNFEVGFNTSLTKNDSEVLVDFYQDLCDQFAIIDELKLNIRIWG